MKYGELAEGYRELITAELGEEAMMVIEQYAEGKILWLDMASRIGSHYLELADGYVKAKNNRKGCRINE